MYLGHWELQTNPFPPEIEARYFYRAATCEEALARLEFLIDERRRVGLLVGGPGSGKTMLLEVLAQQWRQSGRQVVRLNLLGFAPGEFLARLVGAFSLPTWDATSRGDLWRQVDDALAIERYQRRDTVLLLDGVSFADAETIQDVLRLAQHEAGTEAGLSLVLAVCRRGLARLDWRLHELVHLRTTLEPWDLLDVNGWVSAALARAGRKATTFDDVALRELTELSEGNPRRLQRLAELALIAGAGQGLKRIDAATVQDVHAELVGAELAEAK